MSPLVPDVVHAAGALVWRVRQSRLQVALVHRPRYKDWSWPKGKLDPGEASVTAAWREVAEEMLIEVVLATPVDTGKARSNWQVGIGAPPSGVVSPYAPGRHLGLGETGNANGAIYAGQSVLRVSDPDQTIYIGNNVHYLEKLNDGFSPQAGAGFVERAFERARQRVNRARRVLDRPGTR